MGEEERIGPGPVIGHLTYLPEGAVDLRADAEVAVLLGADVHPGSDCETARAAIAGFGAGLEFVDLGVPPPGDAERIVAANIWHRAFALSRLDRSPPANGAEGRMSRPMR